MEWNSLFPLVSTAIVAILGWFVFHQLSLSRERAAKRRELRVQYLIDAWRKLANASNRNDNTQINNIEEAIEDIQLFGSVHQIELAHKFSEDFAQNGTALLDELLEELRNNLRAELKLEQVSKKVEHLRIVKNNKNTK